MGTIFLLLPANRAVQAISSPLAAIFILGIVAFTLGHLVQSYAAKAVGQRETFRNSIFLHQSLGKSPILDFEKYPTRHPRLYGVYECLHPDEPQNWDDQEILNPDHSPTSDDNDDESIEDLLPESTIIFSRVAPIVARFFRSLIEAIMMVRIKRDRPLPDVTLAGKAWTLCRTKYELDSDYNEYGDLLHLMSSDIESHSNSSRALRFQALRNLYRGMWISCYFSLILIGMVVIAQGLSNWISPIFTFIGIDVWNPVVTEIWNPVWMICIGYATFMYAFWELKEDFEEEFVEYLLTDFLAANTELDRDGGRDFD